MFASLSKILFGESVHDMFWGSSEEKLDDIVKETLAVFYNQVDKSEFRCEIKDVFIATAKLIPRKLQPSTNTKDREEYDKIMTAIFQAAWISRDTKHLHRFEKCYRNRTKVQNKYMTDALTRVKFLLSDLSIMKELDQEPISRDFFKSLVDELDKNIVVKIFGPQKSLTINDRVPASTDISGPHSISHRGGAFK